MTRRIRGVVVALACSAGGMAASATNLKPFDPVALQGVVEATSKELLLPGAMVLVRTPQGDFAFGYGATELGGTAAPRADTHFRAASNTKTMTAAVIVQLVQEGKLRFDDPVNDVTLIIMDEPDDLARQPADSQHHHAEDARPDLYAASVAARRMSD